MIFDEIGCWQHYSVKDKPNFAAAMNFISNVEASLPDGKYPICEKDVIAEISTYTTRDRAKLQFESHREFADIQLLLEGTECIDLCPTSRCRTSQPYSIEHDVEFLHGPDHFSSIFLQPGRFVVLLPQDAHKPGCLLSKPQKVRKMVVKVRL